MQTTFCYAALVAVCALPAGLVHAQQDPIAETVLVRVVGHSDDMPRPGVMVYMRSGSKERLDQDGFLIAEDQAVRRLRQAALVRTDPDGRAQLTFWRQPRAWDFEVAAPHYLAEQAKLIDKAWVIRVGEQEPVGVRVIDADGNAVAGFPVALYAAGRDMAVAITDQTGRAVLGVAKDFKARAVICPAGWIGPREGFPTIADSLAGRRGATMKLPPYGTLRLRRLRGGIPEKGNVRAMQFHHPTAYTHLNPQINAGAKEAFGVVYPYVALGVQLHSYPQFGSRNLVRAAGPSTSGEVRDLDIDLGPALTLQVSTADKQPIRGSVQVLLLTDAGEHKLSALRKGQGVYQIEPGQALKGTRLQRFHVDAGAYSVSQACDHALKAKSIDLGTCNLIKHEPQLRGRVIDAAGKSVAGAYVAISASKKRNTGYRKLTDADGRFASSGPILRAADGTPLQLYARARHDNLASEAVQAAANEVTLTLKPKAPPKRKPIAMNGSVTVRLTSKITTPNTIQTLKLDGRWGVGRMPLTKQLPDGSTEVKFYNLFGGTYRLLAAAPNYGKYVLFDDLVVPGDGPCTDPRLREVDHTKHYRKVIAKVVDEQGVPIAGANVMLPDNIRTTDGTGNTTLYVGRTTKTEGTVQMLNKRTVRLTEWTDGMVVTLAPASKVVIRVVGLPNDLERRTIEVWLRDDEGRRFEGPRQMLQAKDTATMLIPPRGNYRLHLLVTHQRGRGRSSRTVHVAKENVSIGDNKDHKLDFALDAKVVAQLRELIK